MSIRNTLVKQFRNHKRGHKTERSVKSSWDTDLRDFIFFYEVKMFRFEFLQGETDPSFLLSTGEVHLELCVQCLASHYKRDSDTLEWQRARKKIQILQHLSYMERMKELGLFRLKKNWVRGDLINCVEIPGGVCRENGAELFLVVPCGNTRANGHKLKYSIFYLSSKPFFFFYDDGQAMKEIALRDSEVSILGGIHNLSTPQDPGFACKGRLPTTIPFCDPINKPNEKRKSKFFRNNKVTATKILQ